MDKLQSYEDWKSAQEEARTAGLKLSNCYFLPAELRRRIEAGVLSLLRTDHALFLMEDAGSFYRCYYWLSPTGHPDTLRLGREAVVELPYAGTMNANQLAQVEILKSLGFVLGRESGMMNCLPDALVPRAQSDVELVRVALPEEIPEVMTLLERSFDPRFAFLPTEEELRQATEEKLVFVIVREHCVVAVLHAGFEKTVASVRQVAVAENFRGNGLGKLILEAYHRRFTGQATVFQHWVDLNNVPAVNMYKSFGYGFSLRKANEYILAPNQRNQIN